MAAHKESANDLKPYSHAPFHAASFVIAESLGNFQHNPEHAPRILRSLEETCTYFQEAVRAHQQHPRKERGVLHSRHTNNLEVPLHM
jgi:hypothetical protein